MTLSPSASRLPIAVTDYLYDYVPEAFQGAAGSRFVLHRAPAAEADLAQFIHQHGIRHLVIDSSPMTGPLYAALPPGSVVARFGVGYDGIDLRQATPRGILCTITPGVLDDAVAEHTLHLILCLARHAPFESGRGWGHRWRQVGLGIELRGRTLAVIGCGPIGRRVARAAAMGFGMRVVGCDPHLRDDQTADLCREWGYTRLERDFGAAVADADFISLNIPGSPANRHFLNADRLASLKPGARVINTARGVLVDERALHDALVAGRLAGAALDVFEHEPYAPVDADHDLRSCPNVLMTDHLGSGTIDAYSRMAGRAVGNIGHAVAGQFDAMDLLNRDALAHLQA